MCALQLHLFFSTSSPFILRLAQSLNLRKKPLLRALLFQEKKKKTSNPTSKPPSSSLRLPQPHARQPMYQQTPSSPKQSQANPDPSPRSKKHFQPLSTCRTDHPAPPAQYSPASPYPTPRSRTQPLSRRRHHPSSARLRVSAGRGPTEHAQASGGRCP